MPSSTQRFAFAGSCPRRRGVRALAVFVAGGFAAAFLAGACTLGDPVVPDCQLDASPDDVNACNQASACDDGTGNVRATEPCCLRVGNHSYATCCGSSDTSGCTAPQSEGETEDFRAECIGANANSCCSPAQLAMDNCLSGASRLTTNSAASSTAASSTAASTASSSTGAGSGGAGGGG